MPPPTMAMRGARLIHAVQFADVWRGIPATAHLCRSRTPEASFDHLVGAQQERLGDCQPERLGGCKIDDEIKLGRLLDRNFARLRPAKNLVDILGRAPE